MLKKYDQWMTVVVWFGFLAFGAIPALAQLENTELSVDERAVARRIAEKAMEREFEDSRVVWSDAQLVREKGKEGGRRVLVIHYRYKDDTALLSMVDLANRKVVSVDRVPNLPVPLAEEEFGQAVELAFGNRKVRRALGEWADKVTPEILLLHSSAPEDPVFGRRVVRMMFRVEERYFDHPIVIVDLSRGRVRLEDPDGKPTPMPKSERPSDEEASQIAWTEDALADLQGSASTLSPGTLLPLEPLTPTRPIDLKPVPFFTCCPRHTSTAERGQVEQQFPPSGVAETAWRVRFAHATGKGLYITGAWFRKGPNENWMRVLYDARLSDIFVPYHSGSPRYLDLTGFNFNLVPVTQEDLGCCGAKADDFVVKEVRDRGILWKQDTKVRRAHELVLWGTLGAANYNYVISYHFRDDGSIGFRLGATSQNLPGARMEAHMHNGLWRIDVDLAGASRDTALLTQHTENGLAANDAATPFNGGKEGNAVWDPQHFTGVRIQDENVTNGLGEPIAYDVLSFRPGNARHAEPYMKHDFWMTRYRGAEQFFTQLPNYVSNQESVTNTDLVLWYVSPAHHLPRREDGHNTQGFWDGVALVMWTGFDLRPRNLFDGTPFHP